MFLPFYVLQKRKNRLSARLAPLYGPPEHVHSVIAVEPFEQLFDVSFSESSKALFLTRRDSQTFPSEKIACQRHRKPSLAANRYLDHRMSSLKARESGHIDFCGKRAGDPPGTFWYLRRPYIRVGHVGWNEPFWFTRVEGRRVVLLYVSHHRRSSCVPACMRWAMKKNRRTKNKEEYDDDIRTLLLDYFTNELRIRNVAIRNIRVRS